MKKSKIKHETQNYFQIICLNLNERWMKNSARSVGYSSIWCSVGLDDTENADSSVTQSVILINSQKKVNNLTKISKFDNSSS